MNINKIKLSKDNFIVELNKSPLKLDYTIEKNRYVIDISSLDLLNATRIAILCSTYCFINGFKKKLCWLVKDDEIKKAISILRLRNVEQRVKEEILSKKAIIA